jgi:hypothetical protein
MRIITFVMIFLIVLYDIFWKDRMELNLKPPWLNSLVSLSAFLLNGFIDPFIDLKLTYSFFDML